MINAMEAPHTHPTSVGWRAPGSFDGILQTQDGVISVKAGRVAALRAGAAPESHDFH
jgi:hypothetical protein